MSLLSASLWHDKYPPTPPLSLTLCAKGKVFRFERWIRGGVGGEFNRIIYWSKLDCDGIPCLKIKLCTFFETEPTLVVVRLAENGCLLNYLQRSRENLYVNVNKPKISFTSSERTRIARDIANGMLHLSNKKVRGSTSKINNKGHS